MVGVAATAGVSAALRSFFERYGQVDTQLKLKWAIIIWTFLGACAVGTVGIAAPAVVSATIVCSAILIDG